MMWNKKSVTLLLATVCFLTGTVLGQDNRSINFDKNWKFYLGEATGADQQSFDDKGWRTLDVPHDWSIEGSYDQQNTTGRGGGYLPGGIGWYRKSFTLEENAKQKVHYIEFDGVMANSDVWINGKHLGKRPFGYSSFYYDISKYLNYGKGTSNMISVRADNSLQPASRYYTGAGIYRHVRLLAVHPVHFTQWGTFVTSPRVSTEAATIAMQSQVTNSSKELKKLTVEATIMDANGKNVATTSVKKDVNVGQTLEIPLDLSIATPSLWDTENPYLYKARLQIKAGNTVLYTQIIPFGVRDIKFEAATGFWLNEKNLKIKGVCLHHDAGAVGAAVPLSIWKERFNQLKALGVNGIRTAHNPMAPEFLDLCDEMGFLVMNETFDTWNAAKNNGEKGYNVFFKDWWEQDTRDLVLRDRNHPSVVLYSVGNEIRDDLSYPKGFQLYQAQEDLVNRYDGSRPVTMALFRPSSSKVYENGFAEHMEIVGQNYRAGELVAAHETNPHWKVIGTENNHTIEEWLILRDKPYMAGQFLWTGFDYLGEANWPEITNSQGLYDRAGNIRNAGLQRESWWSTKPVVHIVRKSENAGAGDWVADWTPTDFDTYDQAQVQIYSNCDEVELFLNNTSLGVKSKPKNDAPREWDVTFEKGTIKAVGRNAGKEVASESFTSAGAPAKIVLTTNQQVLTADWDCVAIVGVTIVDENDQPCPNAINNIQFTVSGAGKLIAVDNGNIISHELYQGTIQRKAYRGKAIAVIGANNASGKITIKAESEGLTANSITIDVK